MKNIAPAMSDTFSLCHQMADAIMAITKICPRFTELNTWRGKERKVENKKRQKERIKGTPKKSIKISKVSICTYVYIGVFLFLVYLFLIWGRGLWKYFFSFIYFFTFCVLEDKTNDYTKEQ